VARTKGGADLNEGEIEAGLPKTANYRYADRVGAQLFVSGQVPHDRSANLVGIDNPAEQASQCLRNLRTLITHHGFKESDIRKLTIYVIGEEQNLLQAWEAVESWFDRNAPPSTLLGVARLGYPHQIVEIDATIVAEAE
jgi:enamine deaminase RidA (YjgF/YER057c/UK114 family)